MKPEKINEIKVLISQNRTQESIIKFLESLHWKHSLYVWVALRGLKRKIDRLEHNELFGIHHDKLKASKMKINQDLLKLLAYSSKKSYNLLDNSLIIWLLSFVAYLFIVNNNDYNGLVLSQPKFYGKNLMYFIDSHEQDTPRRTINFKIQKKGTATYNLAPYMEVTPLDEKNHEGSRTYIEDPSAIKYEQSVNINFKKKGRYQLRIPFSQIPPVIDYDFFTINIMDVR